MSGWTVEKRWNRTDLQVAQQLRGRISCTWNIVSLKPLIRERTSWLTQASAKTVDRLKNIGILDDDISLADGTRGDKVDRVWAEVGVSEETWTVPCSCILENKLRISWEVNNGYWKREETHNVINLLSHDGCRQARWADNCKEQAHCDKHSNESASRPGSRETYKSPLRDITHLPKCAFIPQILWYSETIR